ncbi:MAG: ABC transporter permease [Chloroflexi bacterium]|nr:ABC transporter permease [Chloroflexota bacterium]
MNRIFDITVKDLTQILRDRKTFMFLLLMPILFTILFGLAFSGTGKGPADSRLPVGYLDLDNGTYSQHLKNMLTGSTVIRLDEDTTRSETDLNQLVADEKLAAALIVPAGYSQSVQDGTPLKLTFIADPSNPSASTIQGEVMAATNRMMSAIRTAQIVGQTTSAFTPAFEQALAAWQDPPVQVVSTSSATIKMQDDITLSATHTSPGMMLQFAIAGLIGAATVIVNERKTRSLQRLLTTATSRVHILLGHYLAIFTLIFGQFVLLITFGQLFLHVDYLRIPLATLLVAVAAAACISAMGLLIGVFAKSEEQTVIFVMIPMFVLSGLGGAWMPLEFTGSAFQSIGHVSPVAWAMDGFKNIVARGLGFSSVLVPAAALLGYAVLFFILAAWRFRTSEER